MEEEKYHQLSKRRPSEKGQSFLKGLAGEVPLEIRCRGESYWYFLLENALAYSVSVTSQVPEEYCILDDNL